MNFRVGEKFISNSSELFTIINYINSKKVTIKFEDGTVIENKNYSDIIRGQIKNPNTPTVYSVGYIGLGKYSCKDKKYYSTWISMLKRCYDKKFQENQPTYKDVIVCKKWHNFQVFAEWCDIKYIENWQLDKDILVKGNKIYSTETCCFVTHEINSLFTKKRAKRGNFPIGVSIKNGSYNANININSVTKYLGSFDTPEEAFQAYKTAKEEYIKEVADGWEDQIEPRVYQSMYNYQVEITD